jgi:hypothetical protein
MATHVSSVPTTGATPGGRSRLRGVGAVLATLLLLVLALPPAPAHGQPLSLTPAITALRTGTAGPPAEAPMLPPATRTGPGLTTAGSALLAASPSRGATPGHHAMVAGIPAPLAVAVGGVLLVLVIVLVVAAFTRHRPDDEGRVFFDLEE